MEEYFVRSAPFVRVGPNRCFVSREFRARGEIAKKILLYRTSLVDGVFGVSKLGTKRAARREAERWAKPTRGLGELLAACRGMRLLVTQPQTQEAQ